MEFIDSDNYKWSGKSKDDSLSIIINKRNGEFSGTILDSSSDNLYRIFPVSSEASALIKFSLKEQDGICGTSPVNPESLPPSSNSVSCDEICNGHVDILFLLTPETQNWISRLDENETFLEILMTELEFAHANSNIKNTFDYTWASIEEWNWPPEDSNDVPSCGKEVEALLENEMILDLREEHSADIVVMFVGDNPWPGSYIQGCAHSNVLELNSENSMVLLKIEETLSKPHFSHEIAHIFSAWHTSSGDPSFNFLGDCPFAHIFNDLFEIERRTIMTNGTGDILHYSNPRINFNGVPTGILASNPNFTKARDNAAVMNSTGCVVSDFRTSLNTYAIVNVGSILSSGGGSDCDLVLDASLSPQVAGNYTFSWSWSLDGIFASQYPGIPLGVGSTITVPDPIDDPCQTFFVQLIVEDVNSNVVDIVTFNLEGKQCVDFADDPCGTTGLIADDSELSHEESYDFMYLNTKPNIESDFVSESSNTYYVVDILGREILYREDVDIDYITVHQMVSQVYSGVYFIVAFDAEGKKTITKHALID